MEWVGSEKQIEFAKDIVKKFGQEIEAILAEAEAADPAELADDAAEVIAETRRGLARLRRIRSAAWIVRKARTWGAELTVRRLADPKFKLEL